MRLVLLLSLAFALASPVAAVAQGGPTVTAAAAQPAPSFAPTPGWVRDTPIPSASPALAARPFQMLLISNQSRYGGDRHDHFTRIAVLVQNAQGLQGFGNITLPWQPDQSELIVHHVRIRRGATEIDLLAGGRGFAVLRRENNLESAMLDGVLTAVMQAEGLAVGDILDVAFTLRRRPGALPLRGEGAVFLPADAQVRRLFARQLWPADMTLRWRGTGPLARPTVRSSREGSELVLDLADAAGVTPPEGAPPRFSLPSMLQVSEYRDWTEISAAFAPLYQRARTLSADSPLRAEIARIAAASSDQRVRAMSALRLVQDQVRYFALLMGEGNYVPATAEETWARRYGDCKGKTALLLALLDGLGVEAEPVLVNAMVGDGIDGMLPTPSAFNHVIVRATIDGQTYWLDGTRSGDRQLAELASSPFGWGLPLRTAGAALERQPYAPPRQPLFETDIVYDGRSGFVAAVPVTVEWRYRGDFATGMRAALSQVGQEEFLRRMRAELPMPGSDATIETLDVRDDPDGGTFVVAATGETRMSWGPSPGGASRRFRFDNDTILWQHDFGRTAKADRAAPLALNAPVSLALNETVLLPDAGQGFVLEGQSFDRTVAGTRISRQLGLVEGRATARSIFLRLEREIANQTAMEAIPVLAEIGRDEAYLRAPVGTATAPRTAAAASDAADANSLIRSGYDLMDNSRVDEALANFDRAITLAPQSSLAHANRGIALVHLRRFNDAEQALATALRLNGEEFAAHQGVGYLNLRRDREPEALAAFTRSLQLRPDNVFTLRHRAIVYERLGRYDEALADLANILRVEPRHAGTLTRQARLLAHLGRADEAMAAIDRAVALEPENIGLSVSRADILLRAGRRAESEEAMRRALALVEREPGGVGEYGNGRAYLLSRAGRHREAIALADAQLRRYADQVSTLADRCIFRAEANIELDQALRDCNRALQLEPGHPVAMPARAVVHLRARRWTEARRDFDAILANDPQHQMALYGRALARLGLGDMEGAARDAAQARRFDFGAEFDYIRRGFAAVPAAGASAATAAPPVSN